MADSHSGPITRCPWCSAELSIPGAERCLACGAALVGPTGGPDPEIRGVTTLDPEAILRARSESSRPRNRLLSFITGEVPQDTDAPASPGSLARPPEAVRREMQRLEQEALRAELEAETVALRSDVITRQGIHVSQLGSEAAGAGEGEASGPDAGSGIAAPGPASATGEPRAEDDPGG